jgi:hypothetical protein
MLILSHKISVYCGQLISNYAKIHLLWIITVEILHELVRIVAPRLPVRESVLSTGELKSTGGKVSLLLRRILETRTLTDRQASELLYDRNESSIGYRSLKSRLKAKLLNTLFLLELKGKDHAEHTIALHACNRERFFIITLFAFGARRAACKMAEQMLPKAEHYQFTTITFELVQILRGHYAREGNRRKFRDYSSRTYATLQLLDAETNAAEQYEKFAVEFAHSSGPRPELAIYAQKSATLLDELRQSFQSYNIALSYFRISNLSTSVAGDYLGTVKTCREAYVYLSTVPHLSTAGRVGEFLMDELESYIFLRQYEEGELVASKCKAYLEEGKNNWFIFMESYFLFSMHTKHFSQAAELFREVTTHPRFELQPTHRKEKWRIFELYVRYLFPIEPRSSKRNAINKRELSHKEFLKKVPTYAHDKQGFNVAILIVQILFLLDQNDYDGIMSRVEALKTYRFRYLRAKSQRQSALFFRMLQLMVQHSFSRRDVEKAAARYSELLSRSMAQYEEITETLQILPYDWVWKRVLSKMS